MKRIHQLQDRPNCSQHKTPAWEDLLSVKARMPQGHQDCQLDSNCSQHERTYKLSRQECHKGIKTVSLIPTAASMRGLTNCKGKNAKGIKTVSLIPTAASMRGLTHYEDKNATRASRLSAS